MEMTRRWSFVRRRRQGRGTASQAPSACPPAFSHPLSSTRLSSRAPLCGAGRRRRRHAGPAGQGRLGPRSRRHTRAGESRFTRIWMATKQSKQLTMQSMIAAARWQASARGELSSAGVRQFAAFVLSATRALFRAEFEGRGPTQSKTKRPSPGNSS